MLQLVATNSICLHVLYYTMSLTDTSSWAGSWAKESMGKRENNSLFHEETMSSLFLSTIHASYRGKDNRGPQ